MHLSKISVNVTCFSCKKGQTSNATLRTYLSKEKHQAREKKLKICQQENEPKNLGNSPKNTLNLTM